MPKTLSRGFTIVEIMIVIIVLGILVAISVASYSSAQERAKTAAGQTLANQVATKVKTFYKYRHVYPSVSQLTASAPLVPEAKIDDPSSVGTPSVTNQRKKETYKDGTFVSYRHVNSETSCVIYWDYQANTHRVILLGPYHSDCS